MRKVIFVIALLIAASPLFSQQSYYVPGSTLNLREQPNTDSEIVYKLKTYDNVQLIEQTGDWLKVKFGDREGYVFGQFVKKGRAVVNTYSERYGAICKDGSRSSATGRGACSHHGGVSTWLTRDRKSAQVYDN